MILVRAQKTLLRTVVRVKRGIGGCRLLMRARIVFWDAQNAVGLLLTNAHNARMDTFSMRESAYQEAVQLAIMANRVLGSALLVRVLVFLVTEAPTLSVSLV